MFALSLEIDTSRVEKVLENVMDNAIPEVLFQLATVVLAKVEAATPIGKPNERKKGQRHLQRSWSKVHYGPKKESVYFQNPRDHASILEYGWYPLGWGDGGETDRTKIENGKRWSKYAVGGIITPIIEDTEEMNKEVQGILDELIDMLTGG